MDARSYRHEAQNAHSKADSIRKQTGGIQQAIDTYTRSGDYNHARTEQNRVAKLEEQAIILDKQAVDYEQQAAKLEREAAELDRQLTQARADYERHVHDLETRIKQLLG